MKRWFLGGQPTHMDQVAQDLEKKTALTYSLHLPPLLWMVAKSCTTMVETQTKSWDKPPINWCRISSIHSIYEFGPKASQLSSG